MISLANASLRRGTRILFQDATLTLHHGEKVGVVGRNGCGKSSLLAAILGELGLDAGEVSVNRGTTTVSLRQETPACSAPALEFVKDGDTELRDIERALERAQAAGRGEEVASLHGRLEAIDGYRADTRAAKLLRGLGFESTDLERPVDEFSGGWRMRLNLAQTLMQRADLLLLDEPTNHLDFEAVVWLEGYLRSFAGTVLVISHDRDFLDQLVDRIVHFEGASLTAYRGSYSDFEHTRAERLAEQQARHTRQQRERERIGRFVTRFRAKASKARQAQSRLKALDRMATVSAAHADDPFRFEFPRADRCPDPLLTLDGARASYAERTVLDGVHLTLTPGLRLGLLGRNGAGKTTLLKLLAGELDPSGGARIEHPGVRIGYFTQHTVDALDPEASPLTHLRRTDGRGNEQSLRGYLGGFGFEGDMALSPAGGFSGGEKARLALALLVSRGPNVLLLDEPTNHLDLEMRYALELALQDFDGAMVLVTHDRHLLRTTTDELRMLGDGRLLPYDHDVRDYEVQSREPSAPAAVAPDRDQRRARRREAAEKRLQTGPTLARIRRIEKVMGKLQARIDTLDRALADAGLYREEARSRLDEVLFDRARAAGELESLETEWLGLQESLEARSV